MKKNENKQKPELYFYNGFSEPEKIDAEKVTLTDNYLGDMTEEFKVEYEYYTKTEYYSLEDLQENQVFYSYSVWVNPTRKQLEDFNTSRMLEKESYLENFKGFKQLF